MTYIYIYKANDHFHGLFLTDPAVSGFLCSDDCSGTYVNLETLSETFVFEEGGVPG